MASTAAPIPANDQEAVAKYRFKLPFVIGASAAGTVIEWYDFYLYGVLAAFFATQFFPPGNEVAALLSSLATFGAGFAVRPFGAAFFGRIGDIIGRKFTFLLTISLMGGATALVGVLPTYAQIGVLAPIILVLLRLAQGLALGGEYGGAAIYVAEHAPDGKRGYYTSWIQTTATIGLFVSLAVVLTTRLSMSPESFSAWGWRIPFLLSFILVMMSLYIRMRLRESPLFSALKEAGRTSKQPLKESLGSGKNWKLIAVALFGAVAGQGVVWYTGQFYALFFLQTALKVELVTANVIVSVALLLGTPFFIVFGWLSDTIGRKKIMMTGALLGGLLYLPIYWLMSQSVTVPPAGSPATATATDVNAVALTALVFIQVVFVTMVYGPIAAFLVEFFPARIRYTSMSLPYHIGNGVIGGLVPFMSTWIVASTGNIFAGLAYPITIALITFVVGMLYLPETSHRRIWDEVDDLDEPDKSRLPQPA